jgi:hypothetical protein
METALTILTINEIFPSDESYWMAQSEVMSNFLPEDYVAVLEVANAEKQKEKLKILSSQLYRVKEYADIKTE